MMLFGICKMSLIAATAAALYKFGCCLKVAL